MNEGQDDGRIQIGAKPNEWRARWMSLCPQQVVLNWRNEEQDERVCYSLGDEDL